MRTENNRQKIVFRFELCFNIVVEFKEKVMEENFQNQQNQKVIQTQPQIDRNRLKKWAKIVLFALGGLILAGGIFYAGMKFASKRQLSKTVEKAPSQEIIPSEATPTLRPTETKAYSESEALALLPEEATLYKVIKNGFNPNGTLYSVNIYFPDDVFKKEDRIETDLTKNKLVGSWVNNMETKLAKRVANWPQDYNFSKWLSNTEIELLGDDSDTATVFNAITGKIISRRVNKLNLQFVSAKDGSRVEFKPVISSLTECFTTGTLVQNWVQYPFSCVEKSDIEIVVPGYPTMILKHVGKDSVEINGKVFGDLLGKGSWEIKL